MDDKLECYCVTNVLLVGICRLLCSCIAIGTDIRMLNTNSLAIRHLVFLMGLWGFTFTAHLHVFLEWYHKWIMRKSIWMVVYVISNIIMPFALLGLGLVLPWIARRTKTTSINNSIVEAFFRWERAFHKKLRESNWQNDWKKWYSKNKISLLETVTPMKLLTIAVLATTLKNICITASKRSLPVVKKSKF